jgi:hypothetical protein
MKQLWNTDSVMSFILSSLGYTVLYTYTESMKMIIANKTLSIYQHIELKAKQGVLLLNKLRPV